MPSSRISLIISAISAALLVITILIAFVVQGQGDITLGALGLVAAIFALIAFWVGMRSLSRREGDPREAALSAIVAGLLVIIWGALILLGIHQ